MPARKVGVRAVTLADVAAAAGVSVSAASMALADHPRIGTTTKRHIHSLAEQLGYVSNSAARSLRQQRSGTIALIVPNTGQHVFGHPYFMQLLVGVSEVLNAKGASLLVSTNPDEMHGVVAYERVLRSRAADGAIVASAAVDDVNVLRLVDSGLPVVLVGHYPAITDSVSVGVEDVEGARLATEHLRKVHGLTDLAHISGPVNHQTSIDRLAGFRSALPANRRVKAPVAVGTFDEESGRRATAEILATRPGVQGIFAANDEMAFGALVELKSRGLRVPEDVALVGYDDFGVSRLTSPAITTVSVPAAQVGRRATTRLLDLIDGAAQHGQETLPVSLTVRESCGCPPGT
jgi:DNA-binding LacI/PurR family transcriptional regulator